MSTAENPRRQLGFEPGPAGGTALFGGPTPRTDDANEPSQAVDVARPRRRVFPVAEGSLRLL